MKVKWVWNHVAQGEIRRLILAKIKNREDAATAFYPSSGSTRVPGAPVWDIAQPAGFRGGPIMKIMRGYGTILQQ